jgi:CheY-like chemotaxis protein
MNKILLVDDEWLIVQALQDLFVESGFEVVEAHSGEQAVDHVNEYGDFDLLVTDVFMPGVIDGRRLAEIFRDKFPDAGIIYITGSPESLGPALVLGPFDEVVGKPFGFRELTEVVCRTIARGRAETAGPPCAIGRQDTAISPAMDSCS